MTKCLLCVQVNVHVTRNATKGSSHEQGEH